METDGEEIVNNRKRFFLPGPPVALILFALALSGNVLTDLIVFRTCLVTLNVSEAECHTLRSNASSKAAQALESRIEPYASTIIMVKSLIESVLPAVLSLFFGPWSDRGGRRPLLLAGLLGFTVMFTMLSLSCNWNISPWYLIVPSIPAYIMGGLCVVLFTSICYISDTTKEKDRTMLLAYLQASILSGIVLGIFTGPIIYKNWGDAWVFTTASICCALALIYSYFFIPETVEDTSKESIFGLFKISFVRELFTSCTVKRDRFHRSIVWLVISVLTTCVMVLDGGVSIEYLFTRERLGWDVQQYSYVSGAGVLLNILGVLCGIFLFSRILKLSDTFLAGMALLSALGCALTKSLAKESWHMYLASCIGMFSGVVTPVMRSILTKSVPPQDMGKVFSLTASLETLSPLAGAPLFTLIYSHYLPPIYPAPVFLVATTCYAALIVIVICIDILIRRSRNANYIILPPDH